MSDHGWSACSPREGDLQTFKALLLVGIVALMATACGGGSKTVASVTPTTATHVLSVQLGPFKGGTGCPQVKRGQVTATNESDTLIGTATVENFHDTTWAGMYTGCSGSFDVTLPDAQFYVIHVGTLQSKPYSRAELVSAGWKLSIG